MLEDSTLPRAAGLVLFDVNRISEVEQMPIKDPKPDIEDLFHDKNLLFTLSLLTNKSENTYAMIVRQKQPRNSKIGELLSLDLKWPQGLYSLSHIALPFPINDPLYGKLKTSNSAMIYLGNANLRGERGVLQISAEDMLRLRWNPFFPYLEKRVLEFVHLNHP